MSGYKSLILALSLCVLLTGLTKAEDADYLNEQAVTIALTKFDVNETMLELSWKISNNTDHDVWICDAIGTRTWEDETIDYETFMAEDLQTLVISCRLAKPIYALFVMPTNFFGRYVRLQAGQDLTESLSLTMPISRLLLLENETRVVPYATQLSIEIGYYDEDLPVLILQIVDVARRLNCESIDFEDYPEDYDIFRRYFKGMLVEDAFNNNKWADFRESVTSGADEIIFPYMTQFHDAGEHILDEQILRLEIDGVSIPMKGSWPQSSDFER
jgi:hypothetical protein